MSDNNGIVEKKMFDISSFRPQILKQENEELDLKLVSTIKTENQDFENLGKDRSDFIVGNVTKEEPIDDDDKNSQLCDMYDFKNIGKEFMYIEDENVKVESLSHGYELPNIKADAVNEIKEDNVQLWKHAGSNNIKDDIEDKPYNIVGKADMSDSGSNGFDDEINDYDDAFDKKKQVHFPKGYWKYCAICGLRFTTKQLLETHITSHSEDMFTVTHSEDLQAFLTKNNISNDIKKQFDTKNFICNICCKHFSSKDKFFVHLLFHIDSKKVICNMCDKSYLKTYWFLHLSTHDVENYTCDICGIRFLKRHELYNHIKLHTENQYLTHSNNIQSFIQNNFSKGAMSKFDVKNLFCKVCNKSFSKDSLFFSHVIKCIDNNSYICEICHRSFKSEWCLSRHLLIHDAGKKYTCYICNKKFMFKHTLFKHLALQICIFEHDCNILNKSHLDGQELLSKCDICLKSRLSFDSIKNIKSKFICHICQKTFKYKNLLSLHLLSHNEAKNYVCDICNKSFKSKGNARQHIKLHNNGRNHVCNICGKSFKTKVELSRHSFCHNETKNFICTVCNKSFQRKDYLNRHLDMHRDSKKYTCSICEKHFRQRGHLRSHLNTHLNSNKIKKIYTCAICGRSVSTLRNLSLHLAAHSNTYVCHVCNKTYTNNSSLQNHLFVHSNVKNFSCNICKKSYKTKKILAHHVKQKHFN